MYYWDSSAWIATFILEEHTADIRSFLSKQEALRSYTAIITPLEIESAIQRKLKEQSLISKQAEEVRVLASEFRKGTFLIVADQNVLDMALHLQKIYSLRVADAIQLASARVGTDNPSLVNFLCLDQKLNVAAQKEGFLVPL